MPDLYCRWARATTVLILCGQLWSAESPVPNFAGVISSSSSGTMFAVRWQTPDGARFQAWLRLGESAGGFKLVEHDVNTEVLCVEDRAGRIHRLALPQGTVRERGLTELEFEELRKYMLPGADVTNAPVLSRERARQFYLRLVSQPELAGIEIVFDLEGATLPAQMQARWVEDKITAKAAGRLLLAVIIDGKTELHEFPLKPHRIPEPMTRNLIDSDWDEIALLDATNSLKRRVLKTK